MELKKYQQNVIDDLEAFLRVLKDSISLKTAFADYWKMHARFPLAVDKIVPYHDKVIGVPRVSESADGWRKNLYCCECFAADFCGS